jgi:DNA-binding MarR family transcriptional regulator
MTNAALLMFISHRWAENYILQGMAEAGFDDLTLAQARLFARLHQEGSRLTDLAEEAQVTKQTAGFLVDQLEKAGYVERVRDPRDARARLIRMSEKGQVAVRHARVLERRIERQWEAHLGKERMAQLRAALEDLREITDPFR